MDKHKDQELTRKHWQEMSEPQRYEEVKKAWEAISPIVDRYKTSTVEDIRKAIANAEAGNQTEERQILELILATRDMGR